MTTVAACAPSTRRQRVSTLRWTLHLNRLERAHEAELLLPPRLVDDSARTLGVTVATVLGRHAEHGRRVARRWVGEISPADLDSVLDAADFLEAATILRTRGVVAPSAVIERALKAAPGPKAAALRRREAGRRTADTSVPAHVRVAA